MLGEFRQLNRAKWVARHNDFDPYGQPTLTGASDSNSQSYTGREDDGSGLFFYRARYYSPVLGRFISEDPLEWRSGQSNAYAYVGGNPISYTDPDGLRRYGPDNDPYPNCANGDYMCRAGFPPAKPTCCDNEKLRLCLTTGTTGGMNCVVCGATRLQARRACANCGRAAVGVFECFRKNCGSDKCNPPNSPNGCEAK